MDVEIDPTSQADHLTGAGHDRQGGKAQKVHFEQDQGFQYLHLELRDGADGAVVRPSLGGTMQRDILGDRFGSDDDPSGMGASVPGDALQLRSHVD